MNRALLSEMLEEEFDIVEVENGAKAVAALQEHVEDFSLVLLDIVMPVMDGFEVLAYMNKYRWIDDVPVIMISSESSPAYIERAYEFGVADYISRPFDAAVVHRRVRNTIMLYARQRKLAEMVADQIYEKEKSNDLMIAILSHIVEFRNGESGLHVLHINILTEIILRYLVQKTDRYHLSQSDISLISRASALHDIGKIAIPTEILNKPGKLTPEEFEQMKGHAMEGANMLRALPFHQDEPLVKEAYAICRWHHERWDGKGYPDGISGEDIPISAQVVALADVYDALTSERCYKKAFSHRKAVEMITNGECGAFNPLLLECLRELDGVIEQELKVRSKEYGGEREIRNITEELLQHEELTASERMLRQLECERQKYQFLLDASGEIVFLYMGSPAMVSFSKVGAKRLGLEEAVLEPFANDSVLELLRTEDLKSLENRVYSSTPSDTQIELDCPVKVDGEWKDCHISAQTLWSTAEPVKRMGVIGRILVKGESA